MEQAIAKLLSQNRIFEGLSARQIHEILPCIVNSDKTYGPRQSVYEKGEEVRDLGVILSGQLTVGDGEGAGAAVEPNGMFGEMVVFSTDGVMPHGVVAGEAGARVLFLSGDFFRHQCGRDCDNRVVHGEIVANMLRLLSDKAVLLNKKLAYLTAPDLRTKIAMYLRELYEVSGTDTFNMPLNRDRLADFFAVARPSLSRELINLKNSGVIDFYRSTVKILDIGALYAIARSE